jgi:hypothetical protein
MEHVGHVFKNFEDGARILHALALASLATLVVVLDHGKRPWFTLTAYEGDAATVPYPEGYAADHEAYGTVVTLVLSALLAATAARIESGNVRATWVAGGLALVLLLLQIYGTSLVYSTRLAPTEPAHTGPGLWLSAPLAHLTAVVPARRVALAQKRHGN